MITPSLPARLWFSTQAAISLSLFSLAAQSLRVQAALVSGGPPVCAQTYVSDGVSDYNTIANIFFPEAVVADPSFEDVVAGSGTSSEDEAFNYMYAIPLPASLAPSTASGDWLTLQRQGREGEGDGESMSGQGRVQGRGQGERKRERQDMDREGGGGSWGVGGWMGKQQASLTRGPEKGLTVLGPTA